jgi:hypothetical protein
LLSRGRWRERRLLDTLVSFSFDYRSPTSMKVITSGSKRARGAACSTHQGDEAISLQRMLVTYNEDAARVTKVRSPAKMAGRSMPLQTFQPKLGSPIFTYAVDCDDEIAGSVSSSRRRDRKLAPPATPASRRVVALAAFRHRYAASPTSPSSRSRASAINGWRRPRDPGRRAYSTAPGGWVTAPSHLSTGSAADDCSRRPISE